MDAKAEDVKIVKTGEYITVSAGRCSMFFHKTAFIVALDKEACVVVIGVVGGENPVVIRTGAEEAKKLFAEYSGIIAS